MQLQATHCFVFSVLVWEDKGLPQCSPCLLWAKGAWLNSCLTVAHGTCPLIMVWTSSTCLLILPTISYLLCGIYSIIEASTKMNYINYQSHFHMFQISWPAFLCSCHPGFSQFWINAFLCTIGNGECRTFSFFELNPLEGLKTVKCCP